MAFSGHDPNSNVYLHCEDANLAIIPRLKAAREAVGKYLPDHYYVHNPALLMHHQVRENVVTAFDTLVAGYLAVARTLGGTRPDPEFMAETLYNNKVRRYKRAMQLPKPVGLSDDEG
jgi:hypothetical protein